MPSAGALREKRGKARCGDLAIAGFSGPLGIHANDLPTGDGLRPEKNKVSEMDEESWFAGTPCDDDGLPFCNRCKPTHLPDVVYVSAGGSAFHRSETCSDLLSGQQYVQARGDQPSAVKPVPLQVALGQQRTPCLGCLPGDGYGTRRRHRG